MQSADAKMLCVFCRLVFCSEYNMYCLYMCVFIHTHTQTQSHTHSHTHTHTHPRDWGGVINNTDIQAVWFMNAVCLCFYSGSKVFQLLVRLAVNYFLLWSCGLTSISLASVLGRSGKYEICFILDWWSGGVLMRWELKCMHLWNLFDY